MYSICIDLDLKLFRVFNKQSASWQGTKGAFTKLYFRESFVNLFAGRESEREGKPLIGLSSVICIRVEHSCKPAQGKGVDVRQFCRVWRCHVQLGSSTVERLPCWCCQSLPPRPELLPYASLSADGLKGAI